MMIENTLTYSWNKLYIFVFVYKPKNENCKEKWLWVYLASWDWKEVWSYSWLVTWAKDVFMYVEWFLLWMRKAVELGATVVELCWSNRKIISNLAPSKSDSCRFMWEKWNEFNKLRNHFFSCQVRNLAENKNKVARRLAKIGAWEKVVRKWL